MSTVIPVMPPDVGELMPLRRRRRRMEVEVARSSCANSVCSVDEIAQEVRRAAVGFDDPFDTRHW